MTFNEPLAMKLYRELKNDTQIGQAVDKTKNAIAMWRRKNNLPSIADTTYNSGIHYKKVLTPIQAKEMRRFLVALDKGATLCKQAGVKPDIHAAMFAWGNAKMSSEEKVITQGFISRENKEMEKEHG